jgi:hypothetical protein
MENLYKKLLEKQRLERNKKSLEYYYKNRDYVLQRQRARKLLNNQYYKEWYEKNKVDLNERRKAQRNASSKINKKYNCTKIYDNTNKNINQENRFTLFLK